MGSQTYLLVVILVLVLPFEQILHAMQQDDAKIWPNSTTTTTTTTSPWLTKVSHHHWPRQPGCWYQPWICRRGLPPLSRRLCCRNRCVDVTSDDDNCGFCGIRCPFRWKCCWGFCINVMFNPFHCGECGRRCPFPSRCLYGLCGYDEPEPSHRPKHRSPPPLPSTAEDDGASPEGNKI